MKLINTIEEHGEPVILIADDIPKNIQLIGNILSHEDCEILIAENGREVIKITEDCLPDLILLDIMMPEMDGYETCKILKDNPTTRDIPVIFLTAKNETDDIVKGFHLGAVDYVTKPFNSAELLSRVHTHLSLKRAKDREKRYIEKLEQLNELKNEFLGMAVHDLRNPIGNILNMAEIMLYFSKEKLTENQRKYLEKIEKTSDYMSNLVNDLLDITAIESGKLTLKPEKQDYIVFLKNNMEFNQTLSDKKRIKLELNFDEALLEIDFDNDKITQVIDNLISNAVKYSYPDTKVTVDISKQKDYIITCVTDQGQGIQEKDLQNIFKAFHKGNTKSTGGEKSTGLGLAITKKIVEGHNGNIWAKSKKGKGSSFYFTLPC